MNFSFKFDSTVLLSACTRPCGRTGDAQTELVSDVRVVMNQSSTVVFCFKNLN